MPEEIPRIPEAAKFIYKSGVKLKQIDYQQAYPDSKRQEDKAVLPYTYWVLRPLSIRPSVILHNFGLSASAVTFISGIVLLGGLALLITADTLDAGTPIAIILGAVLVNLYLYLDTVDGNIARLSNSSSSLGEFYDSTLNIIAGFTVPLAVGISLYRVGGDVLWNWIGWPNEILLYLGIVIAFLRLIRRVVFDNINRLSGGNRLSALGGTGNLFKRFALLINGIVFPTLLLAAIARLVSVWLIVYTIFNLGSVAYILYHGYVRLKA